MVRLTRRDTLKLTVAPAAVFNCKLEKRCHKKMSNNPTFPVRIKLCGVFSCCWRPCGDTTRLATPACCHYLLFTDRKWWQMTEEVATQRESILHRPPPGLLVAETEVRKETIRYSGGAEGPRNSYLCATCQSLSGALKGSYLSARTLKDAAHLEHFWTLRHVVMHVIRKWICFCHTTRKKKTKNNTAPVMHYSASILCDAGASAPGNSLTAPPPPPPHPSKQHSPAPNETPCLLPLLWGMHTNRETAEGRQTEPQRPLEPSSA